MKIFLKSFFMLLLTAALITISGCFSSDDKDDPVITETPTVFPATAAANDTSNNGVYKGVFTGSSGNFRLSIRNDKSDEISLSLKFDGVKIIIIGTETQDSNGDYVYTFTQSGYTFTITITSTGTVVSASLTVPNHADPIAVTPIKETSTAEVLCYEGTATGTVTAVIAALGSKSIPLTVTSIWNFAKVGDSYKGYSKFKAENATYNISYTGDGSCLGEITDNNITFTDLPDNFTATGSVDQTSASGTWTIAEFTKPVVYNGVSLSVKISGSGTWTGTAKYQ